MGGITIFAGALIAYNLKYCCKKDKDDKQSEEPLQNKENGHDPQKQQVEEAVDFSSCSHLLTSHSQENSNIKSDLKKKRRLKKKTNCLVYRINFVKFIIF